MRVANLRIAVVNGKFVLVDAASGGLTPVLTLSVDLNGRDLTVQLAPAEGEGEVAIFEAHSQQDDAAVFAGSRDGDNESIRFIGNVYHPGKKRQDY